MALTCTSVTCTIPVPDSGEGRAWYARLLGREPDLQPADGVHEWRLVPGVWLQVVQGVPAAPGAGQLLRLGVEDLEGAARAVGDAGGRVLDRQEVPAVIEFCDVEDPFGNRLSLYREL